MPGAQQRIQRWAEESGSVVQISLSMLAKVFGAGLLPFVQKLLRFFFSFRAIKAINIFKILFCDMRVLLHRLYLTWVKTLLFSFCSIHFLLPRTPEIKRKNFEYFTWLIGSLFPICFPHLKFPFLKWQDKQTICHLVWQTKLYEFRYVAYRWREYAHDKPNHPLYITVKGWEGKSAKNKFDDL